MHILDSTNEKLIQLLGQDAQQSSETLAKQLNLSAATVRRRLRRLTRSGLLRIVGVVNPADVGLAVAAIIAMDIVPDKLASAMKQLAKQPEIKWLSTTTGRFDIIALARFRSSNELSDFVGNKLTQIEGVKDSETFICLDVQKGPYVPLT